MKRSLGYAVALVMLCAICTVPAARARPQGAAPLSENATVKGVCTDLQGNPIADAQVVWHNEETGRTYNLKTNKKGEYFSLALNPQQAIPETINIRSP